MKRLIPIFILSLLFSCEKEVKQLPDDLSDKKVEDNSTVIVSDVSTETESAAIPPPLPKETKPESTKNPGTESATEPVVVLPITEYCPPWIQRSSSKCRRKLDEYPTISISTQFRHNQQICKFSVKSSSGDTIAQSSLPPGSEVVAVGASGQNLLIAPSKTPKWRDLQYWWHWFQTRSCLSFRIKKKQWLSTKAERKNYRRKHHCGLTKTRKSNDLFEDIPIPGDLGTVSFVSAMTAGQKANLNLQ